jgi:hypothetical protein
MLRQRTGPIQSLATGDPEREDRPAGGPLIGAITNDLHQLLRTLNFTLIIIFLVYGDMR